MKRNESLKLTGLQVKHFKLQLHIPEVLGRASFVSLILPRGNGWTTIKAELFSKDGIQSNNLFFCKPTSAIS